MADLWTKSIPPSDKYPSRHTIENFGRTDNFGIDILAGTISRKKVVAMSVFCPYCICKLEVVHYRWPALVDTEKDLFPPTRPARALDEEGELYSLSVKNELN